MCTAIGHVRFTLNSDRESGHQSRVMSALPPKADMCGATRMSALGQKRTFDLFNNFVGDLVETQRHFEAKRLCGFDIYDHSELYRSLDGKLSAVG
jgi:hypothetical protein